MSVRRPSLHGISRGIDTNQRVQEYSNSYSYILAVISTTDLWQCLHRIVYGLVPLSSVRTNIMSYEATPSKRAQDVFMLLYHCLMNTLTLDFLEQIVIADLPSYHLPVILVVSGKILSSLLLLKLIISQAHLDSRVTVSFIHTSLTQLDTKMTELDWNIIKFNLDAMAPVKVLSHRGCSICGNTVRGANVASRDLLHSECVATRACCGAHSIGHNCWSCAGEIGSHRTEVLSSYIWFRLLWHPHGWGT